MKILKNFIGIIIILVVALLRVFWGNLNLDFLKKKVKKDEFKFHPVAQALVRRTQPKLFVIK